jgi:hypothetical protein
MANQTRSCIIFIDRIAIGRLSLSSGNIIVGGRMAFLRVPARYRDGIVVLAALDDISFLEVYEALNNAPNAMATPSDLAAKVESEIKALGSEDVKKLISALTSLYRVRDKANISADRLSNDLYDAIQKEGGSLVSNENADTFKSRLTRFLNLASLNVVATKARELQVDVEKAFCEARILTDLRPVFGSDVSSGPMAMIVVHTMKLSYHEGAKGEIKEIFIGIDNDDILRLKQILGRAEDKAKTLESHLQEAGIKFADLA